MKIKNILIIFSIVISIIIAGAICTGCTDDSAEEVEKTTESEDVSSGKNENTGYSLEYGDLLDVNINEIDGKNVCVIKAKIKPSTSNKKTVDQNYYNIDNLVQEQGCDKYDEIQYWAVADMDSGNEAKVVSFTVKKQLIDEIATGNFPANTMGDYVTDLWIHPSLEQ